MNTPKSSARSGCLDETAGVLHPDKQRVTNGKTLLTRAGSRKVDSLIAMAQPAPDILRDIVDRSHAACAEAVQAALG